MVICLLRIMTLIILRADDVFVMVGIIPIFVKQRVESVLVPVVLLEILQFKIIFLIIIPRVIIQIRGVV